MDYPARGNIACIGAGYWGQNLIRNFHDLNALRIICDSDHNRKIDFRMCACGNRIEHNGNGSAGTCVSCQRVYRMAGEEVAAI